ncbi:hypothetical protein [uncultured Desulfovibrio sp.]|uniref:hypothetical protein n=1 Tax=uncultured Desulfovibrio sp. TaxID=167968 RepID=UPI0025F7C626|nr:hypothetical protein [uncultured Desulfovibrio sp.]
MAANSMRVGAMAKCVCLLRISGDTKTDTVNGKISFTPPVGDPDDVPVAYEVGLRLMHVLSLLPNEPFARMLEGLLSLYPVPDLTVKHTKRS